MKEVSGYLEDMLLLYLSDVPAYTSNGYDAFLSDRKTQHAVLYVYVTIGEIAKRLPEAFRQQYTQVDWQTLIRFRDYLAHNYEEVILERVWLAVEDAPKLTAKIQEVLNNVQPSSSDDIPK